MGREIRRGDLLHKDSRRRERHRVQYSLCISVFQSFITQRFTETKESRSLLLLSASKLLCASPCSNHYTEIHGEERDTEFNIPCVSPRSIHYAEIHGEERDAEFNIPCVSPCSNHYTKIHGDKRATEFITSQCISASLCNSA